MRGSRKFLSVVIASGLDFDMLTPEDVLRHISMEILAHHLPTDCIGDLIEAALAAKKMSAELVLQTLGVETLAEHVPMKNLWDCVSESALSSIGASQQAVKTEGKSAAKVEWKLATKEPATTTGGKAARSKGKTTSPKASAGKAKTKKLSTSVRAASRQATASPAEPDPVSGVKSEPPAGMVEPQAFEPRPSSEPMLASNFAAFADPTLTPRKPNRTAEPPPPLDSKATATSTSPIPISPVERMSGERMKTQADEDCDKISCYDEDTSIGNPQPETVEAEYGDERLNDSEDPDEVTAIGD